MPLRDRGDWRVVLLLCDAADQVNGKLYIIGGGWSKLYTPDKPAHFAIAVRIEVPWNATNEQHKFRGKLVTQDGAPFLIEEKPLEFEGGLEVGRPPGAKPGMHLDTSLAIGFNGLVLPAGVYAWQFEVDGVVMAEAEFQVLQPAAPH